MKLALLAAVALAGAAFAGVLQPSGASGSPAADTAPTSAITVIGSGSTTVVPDRASFDFGTGSQAKTAAAALAASSAAAARVVAALEQAGVAKADLQTSGLEVSPRTNDNGDAILGYTASSSVTATIGKLDTAGAVIDAAVAAGADEVSGPSLVASDQAAAYRHALEAAVADARAKAQTLAAATGLGAVRITAVTESKDAPEALAGATASDAKAQVEPGSEEITATVTVTFAPA